jgi:hypothetical protein
MKGNDYTFSRGSTANSQSAAAWFRYYRAEKRCDYCGRADGPGPRHVRTSDDGAMKLCQVCIAESVSLICEAIDEGLDA